MKERKLIKQYKYFKGGGDYHGYYDNDVGRSKYSRCNCSVNNVIGYLYKHESKTSVHDYDTHYSFIDKRQWDNIIVNMNKEIFRMEFYL